MKGIRHGMQLSDSFVCSGCFEDGGIRNFIESNQTDELCSFCQGEPTLAPAAAIAEVAEHIQTCLQYEYDDAADWYPFYTIEGGHLGYSYDTEDLLFHELGLDLPRDDNDRLLRELLSLLPEISWCEAKPFGLDDQESTRYRWAHFCEVVMHRRRFFFADYDYDSGDDTYSPGQVLTKLFKDAERYALFRHLPSGTKLFRARFQRPGTEFTPAQELGSPPKEFAIQSNRMSPPGIPMFYGCDDPGTAVRETADREGQFTIGCFETRRPAIILDLTDIPTIPGLFQAIPHSLEFRPREVLGFLNHIAIEISKPIERDNRVHISYIPTQIITEYVRSQLVREGVRVDGIKYQSAVHKGYASYVIFATQDDLLPIPERDRDHATDRWLELTDVSSTDVTQERIRRWKKELPGE